MDIPYFYPAHDLALANGLRHFNPPIAAIQLQEDLKRLPLWWSDCSHPDTPVPAQWGWNVDTRKFMVQQGVSKNQLPGDQDLLQLRSLSSRSQTISIIKQLNSTLSDANPSFKPLQLPFEVKNTEELEQFIEQRIQAPFLVKAPWSSSGRGLCWSDVSSADVIRKRTANIIHDMGCAIIEPKYKKVQDFAMLFYVGQNEVSFMGYSIFETDHMGTYRNGLLMSNHRLEQYLAQWVSPTTLHTICHTLTTLILPELFTKLMHQGFHVGPIGIDMMIYENERSFFIHPCIEMNVRTTMGTAARLIFDRHVTDQSQGVFKIDYFKSTSDLQSFVTTMHQKHPIDQQEDSRYRHGFILISEPKDQSHFLCYMLLE